MEGTQLLKEMALINSTLAETEQRMGVGGINWTLYSITLLSKQGKN